MFNELTHFYQRNKLYFRRDFFYEQVTSTKKKSWRLKIK
jgi:hypothetical protein